MPNTRVVRSYRQSGMNKTTGNTTYPDFRMENPLGNPQDDGCHVSQMEMEKELPTSPTPLGSVDLGPVNRKAK